MNSPKDYLTDRVDDLLIEAIHGFDEREEYDEWANRVKALIQQSMEVGRREGEKKAGQKILKNVRDYFHPKYTPRMNWYKKLKEIVNKPLSPKL